MLLYNTNRTVNKSRHQLSTTYGQVYAFIVFLVDQGVLPYTIMQPKIKVKLPEALPRAIPAEDVQRLLEAITTVRDRALILLLLRTGMRIGELLE
jgi:integrase/recombinase XerD